MGYFDRGGAAPAIPVPGEPRLWDDSCGRLTLAWRRPIGRHEGYVVLRGDHPDALAEVARVSPAAACWPVTPTGGPWLAVACLRGGAMGEPCAPIALPGAVAPPDDTARRPVAFQPTAEREATLTPAAPCACCPEPRLLVADDGALACPATGELYAVLATGDLARAAALPFGLCRCCEARQPLIRSGDAVVCLGRPEQRYAPQGGHYTPVPPDAAPEALPDVDAIDAALRANSALLGVNGVFVAGPGRNSWER